MTRCAAILLCYCLAISAPTSGAQQVVAYLPNWVQSVSVSIDYSRLTQINIAFENPIDSSGTLSWSRGNDIIVSKCHANHVKVLVSIGGASVSEDPKQRQSLFTLISASKRQMFVGKLAAYVNSHHLDGIDVDLEGPAINSDYGAFIHDLSVALTAKRKLVTAALSQGYGGASVPASALHDLDFVNIMAYDAVGPWDPKSPGQHSSLEMAKSSVAYWLGRGLPKRKAVLGIPFYGYGFGTAFRSDEYSYAEIVKTYPGAEKADQAGSTIWYNGMATVTAKTRYAVSQQLGGVMIWPLSSDASGDKSLLSTIKKALK